MTRTVSSPESGGSAVVYRLRQVVAWGLGLILLAGTAGALGIVLYPAVTDGQALTVLSGSMTPGLPVGGMVFTRAVDPADVRVGDVVTFQRPSNPSELITHRVVAIDRTGPQPVFRTKGDANNVEDVDPVPAANIRGRLWFSLGQAGRLATILHSPKGLGLLIVLICGILAASPGPRRKPEVATADAQAPRRDGEGTVLMPAASRPAVPPPSRSASPA